MPLSDKNSHLDTDCQKQRTAERRVWCEDCGKEVPD